MLPPHTYVRYSYLHISLSTRLPMSALFFFFCIRHTILHLCIRILFHCVHTDFHSTPAEHHPVRISVQYDQFSCKVESCVIRSYAKEARETWRECLIFRYFSILLHFSDLKERFQLYGSFYISSVWTAGIMVHRLLKI